MVASPALICKRAFVAVFIKTSDKRVLKGVPFLNASAQDKRFPKSLSKE
jgi:hypothetical protein